MPYRDESAYAPPTKIEYISSRNQFRSCYELFQINTNNEFHQSREMEQNLHAAVTCVSYILNTDHLSIIP